MDQTQSFLKWMHRRDNVCGEKDGPFHLIFLLVCPFLIFITLLLLYWKRQRLHNERKRQAAIRLRSRTDSLGHHSSIRRFFHRSFEQDDQHHHHPTIGNNNINDDDDAEIAKLEEHDRRLLAQTTKRFAYNGTAVHSISYKTMTPPPTWTQASRRLVPSQDRNWNLHEQVSLQIGRQSTIRLTNDQSHHSIPVEQVSLHVKPPIQGGILEIYVKNSSSSRAEWREHTFRSAAAAAQFQVDLLALQFLGQAIFNMYQALELVHKGSVVYTGKETVLHHSRCDPDTVTAQSCGVAWDDAMRCLGTTFSSMETRLEALWWIHTHGPPVRTSRKEAAANNNHSERRQSENEAAEEYMAPDYVGKRLMLGVVDFFRLFVPLLPDIAVPQSSCSKFRLEQLLRWRKRTARAGVLVRAYVHARVVVNKGWNLTRMPVGYLQRRVAFDDNFDNVRHDSSARNEYYEATVSRDVMVKVKGKEGLQQQSWWNFVSDGVKSHYQGYSLVGVHSIQWVPGNESYPLQPQKDPVLSIPSLRTLIERNPDLDFFVHGFFAEGRNSAMIVKVWVRSLPEGVDEGFDKVVERFVCGDESIRNRKFECYLQLGVEKEVLSLTTRFMLALLSFLLRLSLRFNRKHVLQKNISGRTCIPSINLSTCGETYHFGGSLQTDPSLPLNYVACNTYASSNRKNSLASRMLVSYFENGGVAKDVLDFTYVLGADEHDEVPERALGTVRIVNSPIKTCAVPISYVIHDRALARKFPGTVLACRPPTGNFRLFVKILITDPMFAALSLVSEPLFRRSRSRFGKKAEKSATRQIESSRSQDFCAFDRASVITSDDAIELAVNELIESLDQVLVPVKRDPKNAKSETISSTSSNEVYSIPLLDTVSRDDLRRYLVACDGSLKSAAVRIVQSSAWRGLTFPIDIRTCRVELQSGQFFHHGRDIDGHPVLYFRNCCLGPWRKNEEATIAAVLHRLERVLDDVAQTEPAGRFTLIIMMGRPHSGRETADEEKSENMWVANSTHSLVEEKSMLSLEDIHDGTVEDDNPRAFQMGEKYYRHTNKSMLLRLIDILEAHYPERLNRALVVVGYDNTSYMRTSIQGRLALSVTIRSKRTRERVRFLTKYSQLQKYVDRDELVTLVGGTSRVAPSAFEATEIVEDGINRD